MSKSEIKQPLTKRFSSMGGFPDRNPNRNYVPFDNPRRKCSVMLCPNFCTPRCGLCELHCRKIHKGRHNKETRKELDNLIKKYAGIKER